MNIGIIDTMNFYEAELGEMKETVRKLSNSKNKTERTKTAKLIMSFLSQINRVRKGKPLISMELVYISTRYDMETDDTVYSFAYRSTVQDSSFIII